MVRSFPYITGRKVRTLLAGDLAAGKYSAVWNGAADSGLTASSDVYLIRL